MLYGSPGVGKTRLGAEMRAYAELTGFRTLFLRADSSRSGRPLSLALSLAASLRDTPGAAGSPPSAMAVIQRLLDPSTAPSVFDFVSEGTVTIEEMSWAIAELLRAASEEYRIFVHVDDLHNSDAASIDVIHRAIRATRSSRVAWLATCRTPPPGQPPPGLRADVAFSSISVPALPATDAERLAECVAAQAERDVSVEDCARIARAAGGNPLFILELASYRATNERHQTIPVSLMKLMEERFSQLAPTEIRLLRAASLLGQFATVSRLRLIVGTSSRIASDSIERLERDGILFLGESGALELHECWQQAISEGLRGATRAALCLECAELLTGESRHGESMERSWRAAELYFAAGSLEASAQMFARAGDQLVQMGLPAQAVKAFEQAISSARNQADPFNLLAGLAGAQHASGLFAEAAETSLAALRLNLVQSPEHPTNRALILAILADSLWKSSRDHGFAIQQLAEAVSDPAVSDDARQKACLFGIRVVFNDASSPLENHFFTASRAATTRQGRTFMGELVGLVYQAERGSEEDVREADSTLTAVSSTGITAQIRCMALRYRATAMRWIGHHDRSLALTDEAATLALASGHLDEAARTAAQATFHCLDLGDLACAQSWLERSIEWSHSRMTQERERELSHAHLRCLLQAGRHQECVRAAADLLPAIRVDSLRKRRLSDMACIALAAACAGDRELASEMVSLCIPFLDRNQPTTQLDFPAEVVVRALNELGRAGEGDQVGARYVMRRKEAYARPLAPFHSELARLVALRDGGIQ